MLCFFANCLIMLKADNIEDVIKDYIAVEIISNIDNLMAATVTGDDIVPEMAVHMTLDRYNKKDGELLEDYVFDILPERREGETTGDQPARKFTDDLDGVTQDEQQVIEAVIDGNFEERFLWNQKIYYMLGLMLYRVVAVLFTCYYYFAPFTVNVLVIFS